MATRRARFLAIVASAVAVAVAIVLLAPRWVDVDRYRPDVERALGEAIGREVALGPLRLAVGLGVEVRAGTLRIGPPTAYGAPPAPEVAASDVRLRAAILPLLRGRIDVRGVSFRDGRVEQEGAVLLSALALEGRLGRDAGDGVPFAGALSGTVPPLGNARVRGTFAARLLADRIEIEALAADVGPGRIEGSGRIAGLDGGRPRIDLALEARFASTSARGTVRADLLPDHTAVDFEIDAPRLDFDELAGLAGFRVRGAPPVASRRRGGGWFAPAAHAGDPPGPVAVPGGLVAAGSLSAREARFAGLALDGLTAAIRFAGGRLALEDAAFGLYGGRHAGRFEIDLDDPKLPFLLRSRIDDVDVGALLAAFRPDLSGTLSGAGSLDLDVRGRAADDGEDGAVRGRAEIEVVDGRLAGVALLEQIAAGLSAASGREASTAFSSLAAGFDLRDRVARTDDLRLRSVDLDLDGRGRVGFDGALDLDVRASLSREASAGIVRQVRQLEFRVGEDGRLTLPLAVRGTLAEPKVGIDLRKVLEEGLGRKIGDTLRELFGR